MAYSVGGESPSTSNTFNSTRSWEYDVFLSFAGKDTRLNFTDHLYHAFIKGGIKCFKDDVDLPKGEDIEYLFQAIEESFCAVLVISQNYAKSIWCLEELQKILEFQNALGRKVFPIFHNVNPADVRDQRESVGKALAELEQKFKGDITKVKEWRKALSDIGSLSGWDARNKPEAELVKVIVGNISTYISATVPYCYVDNLVGIESRVCDVEKILESELDNKRVVVGIWGMGGVGKTTLARIVYQKISCNFQVHCFIANVRDTLQKEGLVSMQEKLLSGIVSNKISDRYQGEGMIRKYLKYKKVLLVLDDVDNKCQLDNLAENPNWFGEGSRILITTRDSSLLAFQEQRMYAMKTMNKNESRQLFLKKAFKDDCHDEDYLDLSNSFVEYTGGLPLALKVLGSYLHKRKRAEWREALDILKQFPDSNIAQVLKISYDGLNAEEKTIFLDIACFFNGWLRKEVTQILKSCHLHPTIGIKVLIEKALLVETKCCTLEMHDLIEKLGRDIVHQESPEVVGKRSRLWNFKDIKEVLENNKGYQTIQAIAIQDNYENQDGIKVHPEAFLKMSSIRLLLLKGMKIDSRLLLPRGFKLPGTLKVVHWPSFPFEALPLETALNELVHVKMHDSRIKQLWNLQPTKMKFIDLSYSKSIIETPDFLGVPHLEHLCLRSCIFLVKVHPSLGELKELVEVDLHGCLNLEILPWELKTNSLVKLDLGECGKVEALPKFDRGMEKLSYLDVSRTAITRLPESFESLTGLRHLSLSGCKICNLDKFSLKVMPLTKLYLSGCGLNDGSIPDGLGNLSSLIALDLSHNDFVNLPTSCFSSLSRLRFLSLGFCQKLESLPRLPPKLIRLNVSHCDSMEPSSDRQLCHLVALLDHEYRGQTEYVISNEEYEEYDDAPSMFKHIELELFP
ncbi:hypothetical protein QN277_016592 [Acacia crassicarpa]|uniref:TIR domain-containing protein n=1 Tax=Acacia crassicarpa TaxID=499986 RepID=A0AAE1TB08_9FABA|nr:hypothetical protein QN277_016592 [Acacia crassicarpa]